MVESYAQYTEIIAGERGLALSENQNFQYDMAVELI